MKTPPKLQAFFSQLLFASFLIPVDENFNWQILKFNKIPPNQVQFNKKGLTVDVKSSASPIIYPFHKPLKIKAIRVKAHAKGSKLKLPARKKQGDKKADDFHLRVGVVVPGSKKLSWMQKKLAPDWVLKLYKLAPKNMGVDRIHYLSAAQDKSLLGTTRTHWASDLITEEFVTLTQSNGRIEFHKKFKTPVSALALWIGIDGDDTKSDFQTQIQEIRIYEDWKP